MKKIRPKTVVRLLWGIAGSVFIKGSVPVTLHCLLGKENEMMHKADDEPQDFLDFLLSVACNRL